MLWLNGGALSYVSPRPTIAIWSEKEIINKGKEKEEENWGDVLTEQKLSLP